MFNAFKRSSAPHRPAGTHPAGVQPYKQGWNAVETGEIVVRCIAQLMTSNSFIGAFDGRAAYETLMTPEGIQVAKAPLHLTGAVMAENGVAISIADATPGDVAKVAIDPMVKRFLGRDLAWHISEGEKGVVFAAKMRLQDPWELCIDCKGEDVDPMFINAYLAGTTLMLHLRRVH